MLTLKRFVTQCLCGLASALLLAPSLAAFAAPPRQAAGATLIDVTISLYSSPKTDAERAPYERIMEYFADGVYEASNGADKIGTVKIYTEGRYADKANVVWIAACHPNAPISGFAVAGAHVQMCDTFSGVQFLADDDGWQGGGYTLAHEWGHYYFSLYDEYRGAPADDQIFHFPHSTDDPVPNAIMNSQWNARGGDFSWLNFSTGKNDTDNNAQHRMYGASAWETLVRPLADDPRDGERQALPARLYHSELLAVAPGESATPAIDLPGTARSDLKVVWVSQDVTYQIVIDHSSSMGDNNKMENAKLAAKLLVDLAEAGHTTIGIIQFDDTVSVVQGLTPLADQAAKDNLKAQIDTIQTGMRTAVGDAAQKALDDLTAPGAPGGNQAVFLLTDGQSNSGVDPLTVIPAYQARHIPLITFGYGADVEAAPLQQMAQDTGGRYYFSPTTLTELSQVFQDAQQLVAPSVGVATGAETVSPSHSASFPVQVDATLARLNLVVTSPTAPGDLQLTLTDPQGNTAPTPACSSSGTETLCVFDVKQPAAGQWHLQAATSGPAAPVTFRASGAAAQALTYYSAVTSLGGNVVQYPEPIVLVAMVSQALPIAGATVQAELQAPDGTVTAIDMRDNGVAPDAVANDGLYSAILDYTQDGAYNATVHFDNSAGTAAYTELLYQPSVGPDGKPIPLAKPIPIAENFVRFARAQINVVNMRSDDYGNTPADAMPLPLDNVSLPGRIDHPGDVDVFRLDLPSDKTDWVVRLTGRALGLAPVLRVLAADGTKVLSEVQLKTASTKDYLSVPLSAQAGQTVYVEVSDANNQVGGRYQISAGRLLGSEQKQPGKIVNPFGGELGVALLLLAVGVGGTFILVQSRRRSRRRGAGAAPAATLAAQPAPGEAVRPAQLVGLSGAWAGHTLDLTGPDVTIGRSAANQVHLTEAAVSRRHAVLRYGAGRWYLQDQQTSGGTYVNGGRVTATALNPGDRIRIGSTEFEFRGG